MKLKDIVEENEGIKILKVRMYDLNPNDDGADIYAATDGAGNFALANGGGVWFADDVNNPHLKNIDGKPHSKSNDLAIMNVNGKLGLYDDNLKMVHGPYKSLADVVDDVKNNNIKYVITS